MACDRQPKGHELGPEGKPGTEGKAGIDEAQLTWCGVTQQVWTESPSAD